MVHLLIRLIITLAFVFFFLTIPALSANVMGYLNSLTSQFQDSEDNFCSIPPFAYTKVKSNVIFLMDFSGSMQLPAYYGNDKQPFSYNEKKVLLLLKKIKTEYDPNVRYYGYYKPVKYYTYDDSLMAWKEDASCDVPDEWKGIGYGNCFSGNFLNFLVMTRIDTVLKALIGGKGTCSGANCILVPQGSHREVIVSFKGKCSSCDFVLTPEDKNYKDAHMLMEIKKSCNCECNACPFTSWNGQRRADVVVDKLDRTGIIQDIFDKVDISLLVFAKDSECNSSETSRYGVIRYSFYENDLADLINQLQNEVPYCGTPTGEALWEVEDFLKQQNEHPYEDNSQYIARGTEKDPYYMNVGGNLFPVPCKKSYVVLISDGEWNGDEDPVRPAYDMHVNDLRNDIKGKQTADVFAFYAFDTSTEGKNSMETVAAFGGFNDEEGCVDGWPYSFQGYPSNSKTVNWPRNSCNPNGSYNNCCSEWDLNGDGIPDNFFYVSNGEELKEALIKVFEKILAPASGTSVASLSQKNLRGAILCQSVFYPYKGFPENRLSWIGYIYAWWFLNTKNIRNIREDTNRNKVLDILEDYIIDWAYNDGELVINKYRSNLKGDISSKVGTYDTFAELNPVFEVGERLARTPSEERRIYTDANGSLVPFDTSHLDEFSQYLGSELPDCLGGDKKTLINYIRGEDIPGCRVRTIDSAGNTWKLGDSTYSSPVIVNYPDYSVMFVGANDGMLHAFRLGYLRKKFDYLHPVELDNSSSDTGKDSLGEELWAFIPKNALPYLRYLADKDYCHIYYVDLTPYVIDVNINGKKRKILIGGMRLGGATGSSDLSAITPPSDTCDGFSCVGLSSYFALDVTNPEKPSFMWEFTSSDLGFSYSGPGIVKENGKYYVIFASGPINYDATFSGFSNTLKLFVLDLVSGNLVSKIDTGITNAFAGRIFKEGVDINGDGNTDYLFFGFSKQDGSTDKFKGGLLVLSKEGSSPDRLFPLDGDPADWTAVSIQIIGRDIMPVTSKVELMKCFDRWYVYFGTGRWFYKYDSSEESSNALFGVPLLPDTDNYNNFNSVSLAGNIINVTDAANSQTVCSDALSGNFDGWYIDLNGADQNQGFLREKVISDPVSTNDNVILFTTVQPNERPCELGGRSRLWALNCATGGAISDSCSIYGIDMLYSTVLMQLSGTNIQEIKIKYEKSASQNNVNVVFPEQGNRVTNWFVGIAPESPVSYIPSSIFTGILLLWLEL